MKDAGITAEHLRLALRRRYPAESHALVFEVTALNGGAGRRADAVAVALWASLGNEVHGFEIKVSRKDLLKELKEPEKHVQVSRYCHKWWLVTPAGLVREGELPEYWGLLELSHVDGDLSIKSKAPSLAPSPIDHAFLGSLMRSRSRLDDAEVQEMIRRGLSEQDAQRRQAFDARVQSAASMATRDAERVLATARALQEATGIDLLNWNATSPEMAETLKYAVQGELPMLMDRARKLADEMRRLADRIDQQIPEDPTTQVLPVHATPRLLRRRAG